MSYTAYDHLAAAALVEEYALGPNIAEFLRNKGERLTKLGNYGESLVVDLDPRDSDFVNGAKVLKKLMEDGWTMPEGFYG